MPDSLSPANGGKGKQDEPLSALLRDLRAELGDFGYQWLAACAVYPRLHWHLTIYLGLELARTQDRPPPDENAHLALARLPWFRKGSMPDDLRLRLIGDLGPDNRTTVRQAIKRLFHRAMVEPTDAADGTFEVDIARSPPPGWREALKRLIAKAEPDAPVHDTIFVRYMMGHMPQPIDLRLDRMLVRLFGARFTGWLDLTTLAALLAAGTIAVSCWFGGQWVINHDLPEQTTAVPASSLQPRDAFRDCLDTDRNGAIRCPAMVALPGGTFLMGSPENEEERDSDEGPQHEVTIRPFAIGRYPVTVGEYRRFVEATDHRHEGGMYVWTGSEWKQDASKSWRDPGFVQTDRHPVVGVSWHDVQAYVAWLAEATGKPYRLPSEAEWEYAARAGTTTRYAFGDAITEKEANFGGTVGKTTEVGAYPANPWGLYDMHGNVWEWVEDIWHDSYQGAPVDGSAWTDGEGKDSSRNRVIRGGSWYGSPRNLRAANRVRVVPDSRYSDLGFRVARTLD